jgi:tetratricopeptide (TPR) repeat protein
LSIEDSVKAAGIKLRKPEPDEVPSRFDNAIVAVEGLEEKGDWKYALKVFDYIVDTFAGNIWVKTRYANAFYHAGEYAGALRLIKEVNSSRPTVSSLLIEARVHNAMSTKREAIEFYSRAEAILDGSELAMAG